MAKILLALHGLHSSPNSLKIQQMKSYIEEHCSDITLISPQLPAMPEAMWKVVESIFEFHPNDQVAVMGSSLGGYLAAKAAQKYNVKTLLINPAVSPWKLTSFAGEQVHPYTHEKYQMDEIWSLKNHVNFFHTITYLVKLGSSMFIHELRQCCFSFCLLVFGIEYCWLFNSTFTVFDRASLTCFVDLHGRYTFISPKISLCFKVIIN